MGMTIDKAIENNKNLRMYMEITDKESENKFLKENYEALDMLIDIAQKYKKIEQIAREGKNESRCEKIVEIIEDENDDC